MAPATVSRRLAAWVLDALIAGVVLLPLNPQLWGWQAQEPPDIALFLKLFLASMAILFVYVVAFDGGRRGATPGKRLVGIRVADEETGGPIGFRRATVRRLLYVVGGLALYLGWLWGLTNRRRRTWHDLAARSVVVRLAR